MLFPVNENAGFDDYLTQYDRDSARWVLENDRRAGNGQSAGDDESSRDKGSGDDESSGNDRRAIDDLSVIVVRQKDRHRILG